MYNYHWWSDCLFADVLLSINVYTCKGEVAWDIKAMSRGLGHWGHWYLGFLKAEATDTEALETEITSSDRVKTYFI